MRALAKENGAEFLIAKPFTASPSSASCVPFSATPPCPRSSSPSPAPAGVFEMLFGEGVHVRASGASRRSVLVRRLPRRCGHRGRVCLCDTTFGAYAGAALSMLMPNDARAASAMAPCPRPCAPTSRDHEHPLEPAHERSHTALAAARDEQPTPSTRRAGHRDRASRRSAFRIDIPRYGSGRSRCPEMKEPRARAPGHSCRAACVS
jgi:hypothetical protein